MKSWGLIDLQTIDDFESFMKEWEEEEGEYLPPTEDIECSHCHTMVPFIIETVDPRTKEVTWSGCMKCYGIMVEQREK